MSVCLLYNMSLLVSFETIHNDNDYHYENHQVCQSSNITMRIVINPCIIRIIIISIIIKMFIIMSIIPTTINHYQHTKLFIFFFYVHYHHLCLSLNMIMLYKLHNDYHENIRTFIHIITQI